MNPSAQRVVLDTNVCLDLWVFGDPSTAALLAAMHAGVLQAVTNTSCRDEWVRVLRYPQLRLTDAACIAHTAEYDALVECLAEDSPPRRPGIRLPRCADPDDQKFLDLALTAGARWLISRDADVLALGRRAHRDGLFEIVSPQAWTLPAG